MTSEESAPDSLERLASGAQIPFAREARQTRPGDEPSVPAFPEARAYTKVLFDPIDQRASKLTHAVGFGLAVLGLVLLIWLGVLSGDPVRIVSFVIYGSSMVLVYLASTLYHSVSDDKWRSRFRILDHVGIYLLIAGSYTPFALITLKGATGIILLSIVYTMAVCGIILRTFYRGRYSRIAISLYVIMGWAVVFTIKPLLAGMPLAGFLWLLAGGLFYTVGIIFYALKRIPYNHAIWHVFVMAGSFCQYVTVYRYLT